MATQSIVIHSNISYRNYYAGLFIRRRKYFACLIICFRKYFAILIFVALSDYENISTTKISRFTVYILLLVVHMVSFTHTQHTHVNGGGVVT